MSCYLRISGKDFDLDKFIAGSEFRDWNKKDLDIRYKGDLHYNKVLDRSVFQIHVSNTDFTDFKKQQEDAVAFLSLHKAAFELLMSFETDWCYLDFGINGRAANGFVKTYSVLSELMKLCTEMNIGIEISSYFTSGDKRKINRRRRKFKNLKK